VRRRGVDQTAVVANKGVILRLPQGHADVDVGGQKTGTDKVLGLAVVVYKLRRYRPAKAYGILEFLRRDLDRFPAPTVITAVRRVGLVENAGVDADGEFLDVGGHVELAAAALAALAALRWCRRVDGGVGMAAKKKSPPRGGAATDVGSEGRSGYSCASVVGALAK
jgi:hypothetical protein